MVSKQGLKDAESHNVIDTIAAYNASAESGRE
jgi:hypothetical protein